VLGGVLSDLVGELKEHLLRTPVADLVDCFDNDQLLIGVNPYCYARMDLDGARELSKLIKETHTLINGFNSKEPFSKRVFAAHSESDATANITASKTCKRSRLPTSSRFFASLKKQGYLT
jgi:hypothetical protein